MLSMNVLIKMHLPKFGEDVFCEYSIVMLHIPTHNTHKDVFTFVLIVFQPLLGAVLLHSLCCNTHNTHMDVLCPLLSIVFQPVLSAI